MILSVFLGLSLSATQNSHAQQNPALAGAAQATPTSPSQIDRFFHYVRTQQRQLNRKLAKSLRDMKNKNSSSASYTLILASLLYGFFHAAGPGHGKAVISGYLLASRQTIRRGIALAFTASFLQALSAIVIVTVLSLILKATGTRIAQTIDGVTRLSYGLIVLAGLGVLWTTWRASAANTCPHHHATDCPTCGHSHIPDPNQLSGAQSFKTMAAIVLAVGIRPCTGAVLMLILALTHGLLTAGLIATFAMSLGTAVTVSALAALTLGVKQGLLRLFSGHSYAANLIAKTLGILAGIFITLIGLTLLFAAAPSPFI